MPLFAKQRFALTAPDGDQENASRFMVSADCENCPEIPSVLC
jgi:hypothetical protein